MRGSTARISAILPNKSAAASRTSQSSSSRYSIRISTLGRPIPNNSITAAILASSRWLESSTARSPQKVLQNRRRGQPSLRVRMPQHGGQGLDGVGDHPEQRGHHAPLLVVFHLTQILH